MRSIFMPTQFSNRPVLASKQAQFYTQYSSYADILKAPVTCTASSCGLNLSTDKNEQNTCTIAIHTQPDGCGPTTSPFIPCTGFTLMGELHKDEKCATFHTHPFCNASGGWSTDFQVFCGSIYPVTRGCNAFID